MLRKISLALLGLTATGIVSAGTMGPTCVPGNVSVPCESQHWDLGVQALYLETVLDGQYTYGTTASDNYRDINHEWDWGFRLEGSYHFSTGNDFTATWIHYDADAYNNDLVASIPLNPLFTITGQPVELSLNKKFDQVNMVFGQHVDVGVRKNIRFYGGLQYADIRIDGNNHFTSVPAPLALAGVTSVNQYHNSDFNGVGPVAGMDYSYDVMDGFSITANTAASILYGTARFSDGFIYSEQLVASSAFGSSKRVIPGLEAKLGVNYAYGTTEGVLNLEAGYQVINYFNALTTRGINPGVYAPNDAVGVSYDNFALQGPYFGVKWLGNA